MDIQQFVRECPICQKLQQTKPSPNTIPFTSSDYLPMRKLNVDTMGPFEADAQGHTYIIVVIDCFSRYVGLYPANDVTAVAAGEALLQHVSLFGVPFQILSDRGSQYVNELIKTLCLLIGTTKLETVAYSKEENGIVERANKEVLRHLGTILYNRDLYKDWRLCIPLVQRIMNSTYHESIGTSPASIITPYVDLDRGILLPLDNKEKKPDPRVPEWIAKLRDKQQAVLTIAQRVLRQRDEAHIKKNQPTSTVITFPIGSYVLVKYPGQMPNKQLMPNRGPLQVVKVENYKTYTLHDLITKKEEVVDVSRLLPFVYDPQRTNPFDVAAKEQREYLVEEILDHRGNQKRKSTLEFLVRFAGYDDTYNEWLPWENLYNVEALHDYLYEKELYELVPRSMQRPFHDRLVRERRDRRAAERARHQGREN